MRGLLLGLCALALFVVPAGGAEWRVVMPESEIAFTARQGERAFTGHFAAWRAEIRFDPNDLAASRAVVVIDLASARTGDRQRDAMLPEPAWFDVARFPEARFETTAIRHLGGNRYLAAADLTIKGITRQVKLPFTLDIEGDVARMAGGLTLRRIEFDIGTGPWAEGKWVGLEVEVGVRLLARRADS
jgi:polyisoprenoid-binding protein YceI